MIALFIAFVIFSFFIMYEAFNLEQVVNTQKSHSIANIAPLPQKWKRLFASTQGNSVTDVRNSTEKLNASPKMITLMLKPSKGSYFNGIDLKKSFLELGLVAGEDGFLYKVQGIKSIYSVCHLYQPGTFALYELEYSSYSGCLFILCLDEIDNPLECFELMLEDFQQMGQALKAQILDENAEPLSLSNINYIRHQVKSLSQIEC